MFLHCTELWHGFAKKNKPVTDIVTKCWDGFDLQGNLQPPFLFNVPPLDCFQAKKIVQQKWEHRNVHFCCNPKVRETRMNLCAFGRLCVCVRVHALYWSVFLSIGELCIILYQTGRVLDWILSSRKLLFTQRQSSHIGHSDTYTRWLRASISFHFSLY